MFILQVTRDWSDFDNYMNFFYMVAYSFVVAVYIHPALGLVFTEYLLQFIVLAATFVPLWMSPHRNTILLFIALPTFLHILFVLAGRWRSIPAHITRLPQALFLLHQLGWLVTQ